MPKVHLFGSIPSLTAETQLYTQRRSNAESPANYRFTIAALMQFMQDTYGLKAIKGTYASDTAAATAGLNIGDLYALSADNIYGMPAGVIKERVE